MFFSLNTVLNAKEIPGMVELKEAKTLSKLNMNFSA